MIHATGASGIGRSFGCRFVVSWRPLFLFFCRACCPKTPRRTSMRTVFERVVVGGVASVKVEEEVAESLYSGMNIVAS